MLAISRFRKWIKPIQDESSLGLPSVLIHYQRQVFRTTQMLAPRDDEEAQTNTDQNNLWLRWTKDKKILITS